MKIWQVRYSKAKKLFPSNNFCKALVNKKLPKLPLQNHKKNKAKKQEIQNVDFYTQNSSKGGSLDIIKAIMKNKRAVTLTYF